ncbi:MAG: hypothetical protein IJT00_03385 [Lachnospiraceae bacterium]|nr:hypothetical protein [Lachnospiraceae bacterium]
MSRKLSWYYISILVIFLMLPGSLFLLVRGHVDTENYENRKLTELPVYGITPYDEWTTVFEGWFTDHLPFKNQLVKLGSMVEYYVFRTSVNDAVLLGRDEWLYYIGNVNVEEDPRSDYLGLNLFNDEQLKLIAKNLTEAEKELNDRGCEFILFLAPNKERIYPEHMPSYYGGPAAENRLDQVTRYLRENTDINVFSGNETLSEFRAVNPDLRLYLRYDTHWNEQGAYVASRPLAEYLGHPIPDIYETHAAREDYPVRDLARLIHLQDILTDDHSYNITQYCDSEFIYRENEDKHFYSEGKDLDPRKVMLIGDSYRLSMQPFALNSFKEGYSDYYYNYRKEILDAEAPDIFIYECLERFLNNLMEFSLDTGIGYTGNAAADGGIP